MTQASHRLPGVALQVPETRLTSDRGGAVAGVGAGEEQPVVRCPQQCRVGGEVPLDARAEIPLPLVTLVELVPPVAGSTVLVEPGHPENVPALDADQRGVPAGDVQFPGLL